MAAYFFKSHGGKPFETATEKIKMRSNQPPTKLPSQQALEAFRLVVPPRPFYASEAPSACGTEVPARILAQTAAVGPARHEADTQQFFEGRPRRKSIKPAPYLLASPTRTGCGNAPHKTSAGDGDGQMNGTKRQAIPNTLPKRTTHNNLEHTAFLSHP